jgi:hypothetical protein
MCGGHRRKPPSEDNDEEGEGGENAATGDAPGNGQGFMLSSLAKGKFVLGPPVDTEPPVVVFTGPADHPDAAPVETAKKKRAKVKHAAKAKAGGETEQAAKAKTDKSEPAKPAKTKTAAVKKKTKPKAGSVAQ